MSAEALNLDPRQLGQAALQPLWDNNQKLELLRVACQVRCLLQAICNTAPVSSLCLCTKYCVDMQRIISNHTQLSHMQSQSLQDVYINMVWKLFFLHSLCKTDMQTSSIGDRNRQCTPACSMACEQPPGGPMGSYYGSPCLPPQLKVEGRDAIGLSKGLP